MADPDRRDPADPDRRRARLLCRGTVQGVGFRPTVHRLATRMGLGGFVANGPDGVIIEVEGEEDAVGRFCRELPAALPPLARLDGLEVLPIPVAGETLFRVDASLGGTRRRALVPPDAALCAACRAEMDDPADRRHAYPFTTCTHCGPRFSLVHALPYDRERTSMACFPLCPQCQGEYTDVADRRFHAEPVCCPSCGPRLWASDAVGRRLAEGLGAVSMARETLAAGRIVALKALGGFQLACRADDPDAVSRLRERKARPSKPFAVMARDLAAAGMAAALGTEDEALLLSARSPILLAPARAPSPLCPGVAPALGDVGIMIPTTPLHVELFREAPFDFLVMTSGNASEEPICRSNREALARLGPMADLFLLHDRDVVRRVDDSVLRTGPVGPAMVRRARGWVPEPAPLPVTAPVPILALGGHLQSTACLAIEDQAFCSQHVGDLDTSASRQFLREVVEGLEDFLQTRPAALVVDEHPDYPSTWLGEELARRRCGSLLRVQHHLAHAAAVLAENGAFPAPGEGAAAVVLDGTGWGPDGTAWGGEWILLAGDLAWSRLARLEPLALVGGEAAVREPWRLALAALVREGEADLLPRLPLARLVTPESVERVRFLAGHDWPLASGAGRLFEAAGALLGLCAVNGYEGEAAQRLEACASRFRGTPEIWSEVRLRAAGAGRLELPGPSLLAAAARRTLSGASGEEVAAGFHHTFCDLAAELALRAFPRGTSRVAAGGGCMVNRILRVGMASALRIRGVSLLVPLRFPPGDGGLSYGQAVLGAAARARQTEPRQEGGL